MYTSTLLSRSPTSLLSHLSRLSESHANHFLLFALSASSAIRPKDLQALANRLNTFSRNTIGCLSAPFPGRHRTLISCSLAIFDPNEAVLFRSTIPGRAAPQVGRWHAFRKKDEDNHGGRHGMDGAFDNWGEVWDRSAEGDKLPIELQGLKPDEVHDVLYFSDCAPQGLANSLGAFKDATKLGLIATSTPFITGRPVTLFHNQNIYDSGAVGIALKKPNSRSIARTKFMGTVTLSPPMTVTQCEGNVINALDNSNPTKLLLEAIRKCGMDMETSGSFKDDEAFCLATVQNGKVSQMHNITAGDPFRGNISLESEHAPSVGAQVQFCHWPKSTVVEIPERFYSPSPNTIAFLTSGESEITRESPVETDETVHTFPNTFLASSENGFMMSRLGEASWTCTVPGGLGSVEWRGT